MISIEALYKRVGDLSRKTQNGHLTPEQFSRDVQSVQRIMLEYYYSIYGGVQSSIDSLYPFIKEVSINVLSTGYFNLPEDYRFFIDGLYSSTVKEECGQYTTSDCQVRFETDEVIRANQKTSTRRYGNGRHCLRAVNGRIEVVGARYGSVKLSYVSTPDSPIYAVTYNAGSAKPVFDAASSVDLEWNDKDFENFVDALLVYKGIETREGQLAQFVMNKKSIIG